MLAVNSTRESDFQAAWYYSIVGAAIVVLVGVAAFYVARGVRLLWRGGDRDAAAIIAASATLALLFFLGILLTGAVGLMNTGR